MPIAIEMPKLSDTMTEGTLVRWIKKVGDAVAVGDVLAEVETDKATMEMEAFDEGTLSEVYVDEGQTVPVGQKVALLLGGGEAKPSAPTSKQPAAQKTSDPEKKAAQTKQTDATPAAQSKKLAPAPPPEKQSEPGTRLKGSPPARKVAADLGVELETLPGSGPGGRIVRDDVLSAHENRPQTVGQSPKPVAATVGSAPVS